MRAMDHPDYVYTPWSDERRAKASAGAMARLKIPAFHAPATFIDVSADIRTGAVIWMIVDDLIEGGAIESEHRKFAGIIVAPIFAALGAREYRIASYLGLTKTFTRHCGAHLRASQLWIDDEAEPTWKKELTEAEGIEGTMALVLGVLTAQGKVHSTLENGERYWKAGSNWMTRINAALCFNCGTRERYSETFQCVECARRYAANRKGKWGKEILA